MPFLIAIFKSFLFLILIRDKLQFLFIEHQHFSFNAIFYYRNCRPMFGIAFLFIWDFVFGQNLIRAAGCETV